MYKEYGVFHTKDGIEFFENNNSNVQNFVSYDDFKNKAQINGKLLKEIWTEIKNADYMQG